MIHSVIHGVDQSQSSVVVVCGGGALPPGPACSGTPAVGVQGQPDVFNLHRLTQLTLRDAVAALPRM
eukprot:393693-Pyramimonas_sp.AAC.1